MVALAVVCIAGLSALDHDILTTRYGFFALLDRLVLPYLVFTIAPVAFKREADRLLILKTLTLLGIYLGLTAMAEFSARMLSCSRVTSSTHRWVFSSDERAARLLRPRLTASHCSQRCGVPWR